MQVPEGHDVTDGVGNQDMQNPLNPLNDLNPLGRPGPLLDPMLDAFERSIEQPHGFEDPLGGRDGAFVDGIGRQLDAIEMNVEQAGTVSPDTRETERALRPTVSRKTPQQPGSEGPPSISDSGDPPYVGLVPPLEARPYVIREGLAPPSCRRRPGSGLGIHRSSDSETTRWCPKERKVIEDDEETCDSCEYLDEDDGECRYLDQEGCDEQDHDDQHPEE